MVITARILIAIPLLFFVPGGITLLILKEKYHRQTPLPLSETLFLQVLISVLLSSLFGLALAVSGFFSLVNLAILLAWYSIALAMIFRPSFRIRLPDRPKLNRGAAAMIIIVVVAGFLFIQPFEYIIGGWDPGVYMNTGINIAKTGSIIIHDDFLRSLSSEDQKVFSHKRNDLVQKYPGFPIVDSENGTILPYFYHLYPVWIAVFYSLFGVRSALLANAVFGLMAVFAVYLVGKTLFHRDVGIIAALLLALNIAQIWQARFPTTEILTQFLIFSGVYTFSLFTDRERPEFAVTSAVCFGAAFFARIDTVLLLPGIFLFLYYRSFKRLRKADLSFAVPFLALLTLVLVYSLTISRLPTMLLFSQFVPPKGRFLLPASAIVLVILIAVRMFSSRISDILDSVLSSRAFRSSIMALVAILLLYGYFVRPHMSEHTNVTNLVELGWFLSPPGLVLAAAGILLLTWKGLDEKTAVFYLVTLSVSCFYIYNKMVHPVYMWAVRRYVPVVIPAALIMMSYAIHESGLKLRRAGHAVSCLLIAAVAAHSIAAGGHLIKHREYRGFVRFCEAFAGQFNQDDIIVCDGNWLATPLHYIYGLNTLQISDQHSPDAIRKCLRAEVLMHKWVGQGKDVYYVTREGAPFVSTLDLIPAAESKLETSLLEHSRKQIPRKLESFSPLVVAYRAEAIGTADIGEKDEYVIDIGDNSFGLVEGFYGRERYDINDDGSRLKGDMRWTGPEAKVIIPWFGDDREVVLTLRMSGGRPEKIPPAEAVISVDEWAVGNVSLSNAFEDYEFRISARSVETDIPGRAILEISSSTWSPRAAGISSDGRDLGVQIDWIRVRKPQTRIDVSNGQ
jgi:hypothetical protein